MNRTTRLLRALRVRNTIADSVEDVPFDRCGCYFCQEELDVW